ncbi:MAG: phage portal protein, partial [Acholeplasma sp.]|nr:phage portal protein [Acholeplasma sp.]
MNLKNIFSNLFNKDLGWSNSFSISPSSATKSNQELYFGIIFSCIDAIATSVSEVPFSLYRKQGEDWQEVINNPLLDLINKPNQMQTFTDFIYLMSTNIDTNGQAFIYPIKSGLNSRNILEMQLLNPNGVTTITNKKTPVIEVLGYKYVRNGLSYSFDRDDLINIIKPNPFSQNIGISTIQMARFDGTNELNSIQMNNAFY